VGGALVDSVCADFIDVFLLMQLLPRSIGLHGTALVIVFVVILVLSLRITILFPAVAVDAPGATWSHAIADTRGYALRIFIVGLLALLPVLVLSRLVIYAAGLGPLAGIAGKLVAIVSNGAVSMALGYAVRGHCIALLRMARRPRQKPQRRGRSPISLAGPHAPHDRKGRGRVPVSGLDPCPVPLTRRTARRP
jgi:hypothetical protein